MAKLMKLLVALVTSMSIMHAHPAKASESEVEVIAAEAGVDPVKLQGAVNATGLPAKEYLYAVDELARPVPAVTNPRVACIENKETGGQNVWRDHTPPRSGDKPAGVLQYFESTFRRGAVEMGHPDWSRWTPWQARLVAEHDLLLGRRGQWTVLGC